MSSDYLEKASQWFSLRGLTTDFPSFPFWWGGSSGVLSSSSVSSYLGIDTSWSHEQHCSFTPIRGAGISDTLGMEANGVSSLPAAACSWVVASIPKMAARGTLPVRSCKRYISAHRFWVDRLVGLLQRPPWKHGDSILPLLLPHSLVLAYFPCEFSARHRNW